MNYILIQIEAKSSLLIPISELREHIIYTLLVCVCVCVYIYIHLYCYSHTFRETNSLRRTIQIVECSLLHRRAQGRVSS